MTLVIDIGTQVKTKSSTKAFAAISCSSLLFIMETNNFITTTISSSICITSSGASISTKYNTTVWGWNERARRELSKYTVLLCQWICSKTVNSGIFPLIVTLNFLQSKFGQPKIFKKEFRPALILLKRFRIFNFFWSDKAYRTATSLCGKVMNTTPFFGWRRRKHTNHTHTQWQ